MRNFIAFALLFTLFWSDVPGQNVSEQTRKREEIEKEIAFLDKQLAATKSKQLASTRDLNFIQRKIANRKKLLIQIEQEIKIIDSGTNEKEREVEKLTKELESLKKNYAHLVYNAYKYRDRTVWILYVLASKNIDQGYRRWGYLKSYSAAIRKNADVIKTKNLLLESEIDKLNKSREASLNMKAQREQENRLLQREETSAKSIINQLSKREREFRKQLTEKRREVERLNREIERILAEAAKAKKSTNYKNTESDRMLSGKFENNKGNLPWPVKEGVIIDHYGQHYHPVFKNIKLPFNNGITITTTLNAQALSIFDGVVKQILVMPGYNQCVLVQHGNYYTFYTKLERVTVKSGEEVKTGQPLGILAETEGNSAIHFQLWSGTVKQNPEIWLRK